MISRLLKIDWIKFLKYNFFCRNIKRKKKSYVIPYFHSSIKIDGNSFLFINGNFHFGEKHFLAKRQNTLLQIKENSIVTIDNHLNISQGCVITSSNGSKLFLGGGGIGCDSFINCLDSIFIKKGTFISREVIIRDDDGHKILRDNYKHTKPIVIGENVWICERVAILKGSNIGDNSVIGFGSIIKGHVNSNNVAFNTSELIIKNIDGWVYK